MILRPIVAAVLLVGLGGCVHTLIASGAFVTAEEVLPPVSSALGVVIDVPKVWSELQGIVDARALVLPPQPVPVSP